jgi:flagellar hook-associated protein 2
LAGMSVTTGLISGIDYDTMITQLMQVEANPQKLLQNKLTATKADADAYRAVNTKFDALRTAAEALTKATTWDAAKATSSSTSVSATATSAASAGTLSFGVTRLAATHTFFSTGRAFSSTADAFGATSLTISDADGDRAPVGITLSATATLADAVAAINASNAGVTATAVNTGSGLRLQVTSKTSGLDGRFTLAGTFPPDPDPAQTRDLIVTTDGQDATLDLYGGLVATSPTNTFRDLMPGVSVTVSSADGAPVTIGGQVLQSVADAIGGTASAAAAGLQLTRTGTLTFNPETFAAKVQAEPALVRALIDGTAATTTNGVTTPAAPGVAQRLLTVAKQATNTTSGTLTLLARSQDTLVTDLQGRIDDWDRRLELRRATLTRQFTAMETALGTLQNQSSWLSSQLASLPKPASSS